MQRFKLDLERHGKERNMPWYHDYLTYRVYDLANGRKYVGRIYKCFTNGRPIWRTNFKENEDTWQAVESLRGSFAFKTKKAALEALAKKVDEYARHSDLPNQGTLDLGDKESSSS